METVRWRKKEQRGRPRGGEDPGAEEAAQGEGLSCFSPGFTQGFALGAEKHFSPTGQ